MALFVRLQPLCELNIQILVIYSFTAGETTESHK